MNSGYWEVEGISIEQTGSKDINIRSEEKEF